MSFEIPRLRQDKMLAWGFLLPALIWTVVFFVLPLVIMAIYSLWDRVGNTLVREASLNNYEAFFLNPFCSNR